MSNVIKILKFDRKKLKIFAEKWQKSEKKVVSLHSE